jgi:hypothetical protein
MLPILLSLESLKDLITGQDLPSIVKTVIEVIALGMIVKQRYDTEEIKDETAKIKLNTERFNQETARLEQQRMKFELDSLSYINKNSKKIATRIAKHLVDNTKWLDRLMDESGASYTGLIFGQRISHFSSEKKALAKKVIEVLENEMKFNKETKCCLLIDSGTTTYYVFCEICEKIKKLVSEKKAEDLKIWTDRIFIITNNLPGIQYLMKHCNDGTDEYSDLFVKCLLIPGEPLAVYAAITGQEALDFLKEKSIRPIISSKLGAKDNNYKVIRYPLQFKWKSLHFQFNELFSLMS